MKDQNGNDLHIGDIVRCGEAKIGRVARFIKLYDCSYIVYVVALSEYEYEFVLWELAHMLSKISIEEMMLLKLTGEIPF